MNIVEFVSMAEYEYQDICIYSDTAEVEFWGSVEAFLTLLEDSDELERFKNRKVKTYHIRPINILCSVNILYIKIENQ